MSACVYVFFLILHFTTYESGLLYVCGVCVCCVCVVCVVYVCDVCAVYLCACGVCTVPLMSRVCVV